MEFIEFDMTLKESGATIEAHVVYAGHLLIRIKSPVKIDLDIERCGCYSPFITFTSEEPVRRYAERKIREAYCKHMGIEDEAANMFTLMDGTKLKGIRLECPKELKWPSDGRQNADRELFSSSAHFLLANAKRILSDSQLFLAPVWIQSGMAYAGALAMPCLGGYIEWWQNAPCSVSGEGDEKALTYFISGSPLSGMNVSKCVTVDGKHIQSNANLLRLADSFNRVMKRYTGVRERYQAYSLDEALKILRG